MGVGYGEGCPQRQPTRGSGERRELPQRGPGRSPGRKRPQSGHFCTYMTKSAGDNLHYRPPTPNSGGTCPPVAPVIYAHAHPTGYFGIDMFRNDDSSNMSVDE